MRVIAASALAVAVLSGCAGTPAAGPRRCDAEAAKSLIGSHIGAVDFPAGADVRMACTTCSVTEDYRAGRLNLRFDEATGIIRSIDCG